jgi:hypothetical protein
MGKILVVYCSSYGHVELMARAQAGIAPDTDRAGLNISCLQGEPMAQITSRSAAGAGS